MKVSPLFLLFTTGLGLSLNAQALTFANKTFTIGSIDSDIYITGVGNLDKKPALLFYDYTIDTVQYLCLNPSNFNVAPGSAGQRSISQTATLTAANLEGKGKARVLDATEIPGPFTCVNPNWTFLPDSEVAVTFSINLKYYLCTGDVKTDSEPCFDDAMKPTIEASPALVEKSVCSISNPLRNSDGTVVKGQVYTCMNVAP